MLKGRGLDLLLWLIVLFLIAVVIGEAGSNCLSGAYNVCSLDITSGDNLSIGLLHCVEVRF